jgi:hypothetical protein
VNASTPSAVENGVDRHLVSCTAWLHPNTEAGSCRCPPPWRIRRAARGESYPWLLERRLQDGSFELFTRVSTFARAADLVATITILGRQEHL